jgi:cell division protein FtsZ
MEFDLPKDTNSIIKVIGVGGGGSNAVNHMFNQGIFGVDFIVCNTDRQALDISPVPYKIQLGPSLTEGRGAGAIPEIGMNAAIENIDDIKDLLNKNTKMVFVTAGLGGGTGTGAAPVIAETAKSMGILTVGIVTVPFNFEGRKRRQSAEDGLEKMRQSVDTLLVINNERLREMTGNLTIGNAFAQADNVLTTAAKGIAEVIAVTGSVNVDFNDVKTVMKDSGVAIMGSAAVEGEDRATQAVQQALSSPLLNDNDIKGAQYVLLNITYGDKEVLMDEITDITDYIQEEAGSTADVIWGHGYDPTLGDKLSVTIIATGFQSNPITGFESKPAKEVKVLDTETKREIVEPLGSPIEKVNTFVPAEESKPIMYVKPEEETNEATQPSPLSQPLSNQPLENNIESKKPEETNQIEWETKKPELQVNATTELSQPKEEKIVHELNGSLKSSTLSSSATRQVPSMEEQHKRTQERMMKIQEYTIKLKNAEGMAEFEQEPAYVRRNVELDQSRKSQENVVSRFGVGERGSGNVTLGNNQFLHDNVD